MERNRYLAPRALVGFIAAALLSHGGRARAQGPEPAPFAFDLHDKDQPFEPGHSCAELAFLTEAELKEAVSPAFQSDFHAFCHPEEPEVCSDYTASLKGLGRLIQGDDGYHCRFMPKAAK